MEYILNDGMIKISIIILAFSLAPLLFVCSEKGQLWMLKIRDKGPDKSININNLISYTLNKFLIHATVPLNIFSFALFVGNLLFCLKINITISFILPLLSAFLLIYYLYFADNLEDDEVRDITGRLIRVKK